MPECDIEHEKSLWRWLKPKGGKFEGFNQAAIHKMDNLSAINAIASKTVWMPRNNPVCFSSLNHCQHFREFNSPGFFCGFGLAKRGNNFKFFFGGILLQLYELRFNRKHLSVIFFRRFASIKYVFHILVGLRIKKISSPKMRNCQFFFAPKIEYKLVAERSEANQNSLTFPTWCSILELVRTHFAAAGGEENPPRKFGKAAEPHRSKPQKNPEKNIGSNHILILGEENFLIQIIKSFK